MTSSYTCMRSVCNKRVKAIPVNGRLQRGLFYCEFLANSCEIGALLDSNSQKKSKYVNPTTRMRPHFS
jgi:hypothetical protein